MLIGATLGTNNIILAGVFYDRVLAKIGMRRTMTIDHEIGYGSNGESCFWVLLPFDKQVATAGNGTQLTFKANNNVQVDAFYQAAIKAGGKDEGSPGFRYRENYYGAYCRDLDGNKLHVVYEP